MKNGDVQNFSWWLAAPRPRGRLSLGSQWAGESIKSHSLLCTPHPCDNSGEGGL